MDLVIFIEEILNGKLHFLYSVAFRMWTYTPHEQTLVRLCRAASVLIFPVFEYGMKKYLQQAYTHLT